jgi:hypothetical protein
VPVRVKISKGIAARENQIGECQFVEKQQGESDDGKRRRETGEFRQTQGNTPSVEDNIQGTASFAALSKRQL